MSSKTMNAIVAEKYGSAEVLKLREVEIPQPQDDEVLIKVFISNATRADAIMRTGKPLMNRLFLGLRKPKHPIPGTGFAGIIASTGKNVSTYNAGDHVFGLTTLGFSANAEYLVTKEDGAILHMPETLDFSEAATFGDGHLTSYNFLMEIAQIKPGHHLLINGASGSLGTAAIQIAKYHGAEVTAVASGRNAGLIKSLGADHFIDYTQEDFTKSIQKYDFIFDAVGKSSFAACKAALKDNGVYMSTVMTLSILIKSIITKYFSSKKARFAATGLNSNQKLREMIKKLLQIHEEGKLKTVIDRQYPLSRLAEAHRYIDAGHKKGNIIIVNE